MGLLYLFSLLFLGWRVMRCLSWKLYLAEQLAVASIAGLFLGTWLSFLLGLVFGLNQVPILTIIVAIGLGLLLVRYCKKDPVLLPASLHSVGYLAGTFLIAIFFLSILSTHYLFTQPDAWYSNGNTWADLALHLSLASYFAGQSHFSGAFSLFHDSKLTYPFLIDYLSSVFYRAGWTWQEAFVVPSFILIFSFTQIIFFLVYRWSKSTLAGWLSLALFLLGGSSAGFLSAWHDYQASNSSLSVFMGKLGQDYAHIPQSGLHFTNMIDALLLPQRGIAFGLAVFSVFLLAMYHLWLEKEASPKLAIFGALLLGGLPFIHVHTFLVAGLVWLLVGIHAIRREKKAWKIWLGASLLALICAFPQLLWQFVYAFHSDFTAWNGGWMASQPAGQSLFLFWLRNFAIILPLFILSFFAFANQKKSETKFWLSLGGIGAFLFILCHLVILQPNAWDNIKLLAYWYLFSCVLGGVLIARFRWLLILVPFFILPGLLSLQYDRTQSYALVETSDIAIVKQIAVIVPEQDKVLTSWQHNHPMNMLGGRAVVMGYPGWLWSYGIDYLSTQTDVETMYAGGANAKELLKKYDVSYVLISPWEYATMTINKDFWQQYPAIQVGSDWTLYKIKN